LIGIPWRSSNRLASRVWRSLQGVTTVSAHRGFRKIILLETAGVRRRNASTGVESGEKGEIHDELAVVVEYLRFRVRSAERSWAIWRVPASGNEPPRPSHQPYLPDCLLRLCYLDALRILENCLRVLCADKSFFLNRLLESYHYPLFSWIQIDAFMANSCSGRGVSHNICLQFPTQRRTFARPKNHDVSDF
jgi:hypothetical protein